MLFVPRLPEAYGVWMGELHGPGAWGRPCPLPRCSKHEVTAAAAAGTGRQRLATPNACAPLRAAGAMFQRRAPPLARPPRSEHFKQKYAVDVCAYVDEMAATLAARGAPCLHVLSGTNTDSGSEVAPPPAFEGGDKFYFEKEGLFPAITEVRGTSPISFRGQPRTSRTWTARLLPAAIRARCCARPARAAAYLRPPSRPRRARRACTRVQMRWRSSATSTAWPAARTSP